MCISSHPKIIFVEKIEQADHVIEASTENETFDSVYEK